MPDDVTPDPAAPPDAGATRPEITTDRDVSRRRLRNAMLNPSRSQVVVGVLLAAVGFATVTQVRATELDDTYVGKRDQELLQLFNGLTIAGQRAEGELARLERVKRDLQDDTSRREAALVQARAEADSLDLLAGLVPATGPGIRVTITETTDAVPAEVMLDTLQELRSGDAEAMEFNDQVRVVAQTAFDTDSEGLLIDGQRLTPPYTLDVIGDPRNLTEALTFPGGPIDQFDKIGVTVEVAVSDDIMIESVREPVRPQYAQPDDR